MKVALLPDEVMIELITIPQTIKDILVSMNITDVKGLAISVNGSIVPANSYSSFNVSANDDIEIIKATQGG